MAPPVKSRLWQRCRTLFRWFRLGVLLLVLAALCALLYLNQAGLPGFVKDPLLEKLRTRGLDLQFTRLRWRWHHGIVAENVRFGRSGQSSSPTLAVKEVQVRLSYPALVKGQVQVDALVLREGRLSWPASATNQMPRVLAVEDIQTELRLLPGDVWDLFKFQAQFAGANINLSGTITNASAIREWKFFQPKQPPPPGARQNHLDRMAYALEGIRSSSSSQLKVAVRGDGRDLQSFAALLTLHAPDANTPWGTVKDGLFYARLFPATKAELPRAEVSLQADAAQTRWATVSNLDLTLHLFSAGDHTNVVGADLDITAARAETKWGRAANARFTAQWVHSLTNAIPLSGHGELWLDDASTPWGGAKRLKFTGNLSSPVNAAAQGDESWGWWANLAPCSLDWECRLDTLQSPNLQAGELICAGKWHAPELEAARLYARLYDGELNANARLNVASRQLSFSGSSDFDLQKISGLLTEKSRHWLSQFSWDKPPALKAGGTVILPAWTNRQPDWRVEVQPTVRLQGQFHVGSGAFRGVPATSADSHFTYSNRCWRLPDLVAIRPEGRLDLVHESNEYTKDYYFRIRSTLDMRAFRPLLETNQQRGLDFVTFTLPPVVEGEIWGRWYEHDRIGAKGTVALTNFTFRGQPVGSLQSALEYTNGLLKCIEPRAESGPQHAGATSVIVDFMAHKVRLTNGVGTADPLTVARMIGPKAGHTMEPYHFLQLASARVEGVIPIHDEREADLHFDVDSGPFEWWKLKVPRISGKVDWVGERLVLRDVAAEFYQGTAAGGAEFNFHRSQGADFHFDAGATNADIHLLAGDLSEKTNRLEGRLTARLTITQANSADRQSWQGNGSVDLRDGLIWEIPIFGILSPVLDSIVPGLGHSRATEGSATFIITNSVVHSDDLEIRTPTMRLQYWGTVDVKSQVDAHAEAELLRNTWVVGRLLSFALWPVSKIFEYKITGTLHQPRSEPVFFVPKIILLPLHPIRTIKELVPESPQTSSTNAPPATMP
jgi:hypothetical protein